MPSAAVCISCISIHALCEEGDLMVIRVPPRYSDFYPRPLRGGRPHIHIPALFRPMISIHALCEEGDFRWLSFASYV